MANMGQDSTPDPAAPFHGPPRRPLLLLAGVTGAGLALLLGVVFRDWIPGPWRTGGGPDDPFPPGALAGYVPEDSEAVLAVDLRSLLDSPVGRQLAPSLKRLVGLERRFRWMELAGINPLDDVDSLQISFAPGSGGQPLWLAHGRFDRSRFQVASDKLRPTTAGPFRAWEYVDRPAKRTTVLALASDALLASETPARVVAALEQARNHRPVSVRNARLRDLLAKVDRRRCLGLAASLKDFGPVARFDGIWLEMVLRPLLTHAQSVYGGLDCGDDLRAELHFRTATEESAARLETDLKSICAVAESAPLLFTRQRELLPLFRLLANGQVSRAGNIVSLHCRLAAEELDR
jgi:hypothetical protein